MKIKIVRPALSLLAVIWAVIFFYQCAPLIARFDPIAFQQATSLRVESLMLMDKAIESYSQNEQEINALMLKVEQAYEYAFNKPKNMLTANQWKVLKNPERNLLGGFMSRWKEKDRLGAVYIEEAKKIIVDAFDTIIDLEKRKRM
jgi:hypothetical protein